MCGAGDPATSLLIKNQHRSQIMGSIEGKLIMLEREGSHQEQSMGGGLNLGLR